MLEPHADPRPGMSIADLVREAIEESRTLLQTEVALARDELRDELVAARTAAISFGIAALLLTLGLAVLLCAAALALPMHWLSALIIGVACLGIGSGAGLFAYRRLPKSPLPETRARLETDAQVLRERLA